MYIPLLKKSCEHLFPQMARSYAVEGADYIDSSWGQEGHQEGTGREHDVGFAWFC